MNQSYCGCFAPFDTLSSLSPSSFASGSSFIASLFIFAIEVTCVFAFVFVVRFIIAILFELS
jgi:hypothetical protein